MGLSGVIMFLVWIFVALICIPISCFCGVIYVFCSLFEPCINPCSDLCELLMKGAFSNPPPFPPLLPLCSDSAFALLLLRTLTGVGTVALPPTAAPECAGVCLVQTCAKKAVKAL